MREREVGLEGELAERELRHQFQFISPEVVATVEAVGEVERVGTPALLVAEGVAVGRSPLGGEGRLLADGLHGGEMEVEAEVVGGRTEALSVERGGAVLQVVVRTQRRAALLPVAVVDIESGTEHTLIKHVQELVLQLDGEAVGVGGGLIRRKRPTHSGPTPCPPL